MVYLGTRRIRSAGRTSGSIEITLPAQLRALEGVRCRLTAREGTRPEIVIQPDCSAAQALFADLWQKLAASLGEAELLGDFSPSDFTLTLFPPHHWQERPPRHPWPIPTPWPSWGGGRRTTVPQRHWGGYWRRWPRSPEGVWTWEGPWPWPSATPSPISSPGALSAWAPISNGGWPIASSGRKAPSGDHHTSPLATISGGRPARASEKSMSSSAPGRKHPNSMPRPEENGTGRCWWRWGCGRPHWPRNLSIPRRRRRVWLLQREPRSSVHSVPYP